MSDVIKNGQIWRHNKSGGEYEIVATDSMIQVSSLEEGDTPTERVMAEYLEDQVWITYRPVKGHRLFFRMHDEFCDGRFELVRDVE